MINYSTIQFDVFDLSFIFFLIFTRIKLVASVLACACAIARVKWKWRTLMLQLAQVVLIIWFRLTRGEDKLRYEIKKVSKYFGRVCHSMSPFPLIYRGFLKNHRRIEGGEGSRFSCKNKGRGGGNPCRGVVYRREVCTDLH